MSDLIYKILPIFIGILLISFGIDAIRTKKVLRRKFFSYGILHPLQYYYLQNPWATIIGIGAIIGGLLILVPYLLALISYSK